MACIVSARGQWKATDMTLKTTFRPGLFALALLALAAPALANPDVSDNTPYMVSQDASFGYGILIPADRVPPGVRVISYSDYMLMVRQGRLQPRKLVLARDTRPAWSIGVFR